MRRSYHTIDKQGKANARKLGELLSKNGQHLGAGKEVEVPAYQAMQDQLRASARLLDILLRSVSTCQYGSVLTLTGELDNLARLQKRAHRFRAEGFRIPHPNLHSLAACRTRNSWSLFQDHLVLDNTPVRGKWHSMYS